MFSGLDRRAHRKQGCPWGVSTEGAKASQTGQGCERSREGAEVGCLCGLADHRSEGGLRTPWAVGNSIREQPLKVCELVSEEMRIHFRQAVQMRPRGRV